MAISIKKHKPQLRCYKCNDPAVTHLCCNCHVGICDKHKPVFEITKFTTFIDQCIDLILKDRVKTHRINLCQHCILELWKERAWVEARPWFLLALTLLTLFWFFNDDIVLEWMSEIGIALLSIVILGMLWFWLRWIHTLPLLLSPPKVEALKVAETLTGKFVFNDEGKGEKFVELAQGKLNINVRFTDLHQKEVKSYTRKYWYRSKKKMDIRIGYALMKGGGAIKSEKEIFVTSDHYLIPLTDALENQTFLSGTAGDKIDQPKWNISYGYTIEKSAIPLSILPSFPLGSKESVLKLSFFVEPNGDVGSLELKIPTSYGTIEECIPPIFTLNREDPDMQKLSWFKPYGALNKVDKDLFVVLIRFNKSILNPNLKKENETVTDMKPISGKIGFPLKGAVSGFKEVIIFDAVGKKWDTGQSLGAGSAVTCEFELSLKSLRYGEKKKILPIPSLGNQINQFMTLPFEDAVPDADTIIALTNALEKKGFYIKQVIEASNLGDQSDEYLRNWTIDGRRYEELYAVSFQMLISGREIDNGYIEDSSGSVRLSFHVNGLYAGEEMEETVYAVWKDIMSITQDVLKE